MRNKKIILLFINLNIFLCVYAQYNKEEVWDNRLFGLETTVLSDELLPPMNVEGAYTGHKQEISLDNNSLSNLTPEPISNWTFLGPYGFPKAINEDSYSSSIGKGQIRSLYIDSDIHSIIYAGSYRGGLWKTTNNGDSWFCLTSHVPGMNGINDIVVHPTNKNIIYVNISALTNYSTGIFKTTDGGTTWNMCPEMLDANGNELFPSQFNEIVKLVMDPDDPSILYTLVSNFPQYNCIYRTSDGGGSWLRVYYATLDESLNQKINDIAFVHDISGNKKIIAVSDKVIISTDNGIHWIENNSLLNSIKTAAGNVNDIMKGRSLFAHENYPNLLWLGFKLKEANRFNIVRYNFSMDQLDLLPGTQIVEHSDGFKIKVSTLDQNIIYVGCSASCLRRYNGSNYEWINCTEHSGGDSYNHCGEELSGLTPNWIHTDIRTFEVLAEDIDGDGKLDDAIITGDDGGVTRNTKIIDGGLWEWKNISDDNDGDADGLNCTELNSIAIYEPEPGYLHCGAHDLAGFRLYNGVWENYGGGDHGPVQVNYGDPELVFVKSNSASFRYSNRGATNDGAFYGGEYKSAGYAFTEIHPTDPTVIYLGTLGSDGKLWRWENTMAPDQLDIVSVDVSPREMFHPTSLAISPSDPDVMYVFSGQVHYGNDIGGLIYRTLDGLSTPWENITDKTSQIYDMYKNEYVDASVVNPESPGELWVGFNGVIQRDKVFHSTDFGETWEPLHVNFPAGTWVRDLAYDAENKYLYAATDKGVWVYDDILKIWYDYSYYTLPYCMVSEIELNHMTEELYVSTYGYGAWKSKFKFCPATSNVILPGPIILDERVESSNYIKSSSTITSSAEVVFAASEYIELTPGFVSSDDFMATVKDYNSCSMILKNNNIESGPDLLKMGNEEITEESFKISPNPNSGIFTIVKIGEKGNSYDVIIFNMQGKIIQTYTDIMGLKNFNIENFPNGIYYVKISSNNKHFIRKVIKI